MVSDALKQFIGEFDRNWHGRVTRTREVVELIKRFDRPAGCCKWQGWPILSPANNETPQGPRKEPLLRRARQAAAQLHP